MLHVIDLPESTDFFEGYGALHFEDMSMVPIQTKMININLLSDDEVSIEHEQNGNLRLVGFLRLSRFAVYLSNMLHGHPWEALFSIRFN